MKIANAVGDVPSGHYDVTSTEGGNWSSDSDGEGMTNSTAPVDFFAGLQNIQLDLRSSGCTWRIRE